MIILGLKLRLCFSRKVAYYDKNRTKRLMNDDIFETFLQCLSQKMSQQN